MIRSYPFAMVFTLARTVRVVAPANWLGPTGGEGVLWIGSALAAFLPSIFLDWSAAFKRTSVKVATAAHERPAVTVPDR